MNREQELTLQRLVDGELNHQQRSQFLKSVDEHPEIWRTIALAFVEDQIWSQWGDANHSISGSTAESELPVADLSESSPEIDSKLPMARDRSRGGSWWQGYGPKLMLMAAGALFALTIAVRFENAGHFDNHSTRASDSSSPLDQPATPRLVDRAGSPPPATLVNQTEPVLLDMGNNVQVPLYSQVDQMRDELTRSGFNLSPQFQRQMIDAGYHVQPDVQFISGRDAEGRSFLVPVQRLRIHSFVQ